MREHSTELEETYRATWNILEDFGEERKKLTNVQAALMNILEDIEAERFKTEKTNKLLEAVNNELEAFSYSVSHDLRAPLRAVSGFAQVLLEDFAPRLDEDGKRYLDLIQTNAHRMGKLIDDLLTFSRLGRQQIMVTGIDMESLARGIFEELAVDAERKIKFTASSAPWARGDKAMIQQVLTNLLSNAIKFTKNREEALIEFGYRSQYFPPPSVRKAGDEGAGNEENGIQDAALDPPYPSPLPKGEGTYDESPSPTSPLRGRGDMPRQSSYEAKRGRLC